MKVPPGLLADALLLPDSVDIVGARLTEGQPMIELVVAGDGLPAEAENPPEDALPVVTPRYSQRYQVTFAGWARGGTHVSVGERAQQREEVRYGSQTNPKA